MTAAPLPPDESARLLDLARYGILDTDREETFERITRLAARLLRVPVVALNFVDADRQWAKAGVGLDGPEVPRAHSFCAWAILQDAPMVIPDATIDPNFQHNPLVTGAPHIHTYAGAPLITSSGQRIGTLCIADDAPHPLTDDDLTVLQDLAALAMTELELRARNAELARTLNAHAERAEDLQQQLAHAHTLDAVNALADLTLAPDEVALRASALLGSAIDAEWTGLLTFQGDTVRAHTAYLRPGVPAELLALTEHLGRPGGMTLPLRHLSTPAYMDEYGTHPQACAEVIAAGVQALAWLPLGMFGGVTFLLVAVRARETRRVPWRTSDRALLEAAARSVRAALQRREVLAAVALDARQDSLTGILNRRAFDEDLAGVAAPFTLAMVDLDGFKALNDAEGHAAGDRALRVFATALQAELPDERVYRLGGDEFVVRLMGSWTEDEVLEHVDVAVLAAGSVTRSRLGASVGVATGGHADAPAAVLQIADERMYATKRRRRALQTVGR
ncbi:sensor domain-containing diguanylate cyclase [Deinococcus maricopensis]|uniref:Diguanylate cyclase with GAF sensor n=1 Tax=Deinococcus maricopensis (strain DSM 21211 / LMG 22137 / NRRL B-23946 / LB-34) TaxID=709986 RepID=E8U355_DEIML|nr:sensor domain-containing diguanylate cyclase [Deinococcus maricopensis]ADV66000.1 diguanylate cyclase with GAF sensor [Deinococcus maricopensis DSM 21211]